MTADASASGHGLSGVVGSADLGASSATSSLALSACVKEEVAEESESTEKDGVFAVASWFVDILFCKHPFCRCCA